MAEQQRRRKEEKRVYQPTESLLTRHRQEGNAYAEGLLNLGIIHVALIPLAIAIREVYSPGSNARHFSGLHHLIGGPRELATALLIIAGEFLISFAVYFCFRGWAVCHRFIGRAANFLFLLPLVLFAIISRYLLLSRLLEIDFPPGARFACCLQQLILVFKWVSFLYENSQKVLYPWHKDDETGPAVWYGGQMEPHIGSFSSYVYFLFCPVLLYRDRYPRKPRNFQSAARYFFMFLVLVWVTYVILFEFGMPQSMHRDEIRRVAVHNVFLGFILLVCSHTFLLHCWSNCWGELLGFADCTFYEEWWNTESLSEYLRKWNPIIHEWLKAYVYRPLRTRGVPAWQATLVILVVSAFEHDFLLSAGLGYFMPVYMIEYGVCGMLLNLKPKMGRWFDQMVMCFGLSIGLGLQMTLYCTEIAAQIHCPASSQNASWFEGLRMIDCYRQFNS